jgi:hypothetical protein
MTIHFSITGKEPGERFRIRLDFTPLLEVGDTAASVTVTAVDDAEADATAELIDDPSLAGNTVVFACQGGVDEVVYIVTETLTTTDGDVFIQRIRVPVKA